ncbi:MAG TPA: IS110 family transposase [Thermofilum sp.]|nr:IS110 family transposase [Thermofilum sp.]
MKAEKCVAGCDLHRDFVSVAFLSLRGELLAEKRYPVTLRGMAALALDLAALGCRRLAVESVGHFWPHFLYTLQKLYREACGRRLAALLVNPLSTRGFGKKTDALDARRIARLLLAGNLIASNIPPTLEAMLFKLLCRLRHRLAQDRAKAANRLRKLLAVLGYRPRRLSGKLLRALGRVVGGEPLRSAFEEEGLKPPRGLESLDAAARAMLSSLLSLYAQLSGELARLDAAIAEQAAELYGGHYWLLLTVPGVGPLLAAIILAETVDARRFPSARHYKSYCGLAPKLRESGGKARLGRCGFGNPVLRWAFYMAAVNAVRGDPELRAFYERLLARGKPRRVALVAVAGKLARRCWAVLRSGEPYRCR